MGGGCFIYFPRRGNLKIRHPKLSKTEPVFTCKSGWCVGLGQEGRGYIPEGGGTVRNTLKGGGKEKRGGETIFLLIKPFFLHDQKVKTKI